MFLDSGRDIARWIKTLIDDEVHEPLRLAVAYWGAGADFDLRGRCRIVCDLESGGCNPFVIRKLLERDHCIVLKRRRLHAKVVIGSHGAVVSSANMSTNGLGAEGDDLSGSIEAGYFVAANMEDHRAMANWFEQIWNEATTITECDLALAQEKWNARHADATLPPEPASDLTRPLRVDPFDLLEVRIRRGNALRAVRPAILDRMKLALPGVEPRHLGKLASWACHLVLNQTGSVLDYTTSSGKGGGQATDDWIVGRFGNNKSEDTETQVAILLHAMQRDVFFSADTRHAASRVSSAPAWVGRDDVCTTEADTGNRQDRPGAILRPRQIRPE